MNSENQNPLSDQEALRQLNGLLARKLPNKGDGMEFEKPIVPAILRKDDKHAIKDMACHAVYNAGDGKFVFRDMKYRAYVPLNFMTAKESQAFMETVRQAGQEAVNRYRDGNAMRDAFIARVTTPTARQFTPGQTASIRRYLGSFGDPQERDARVSHIWDEARVAGNFQKHPEKWEKDALSEFNAIKSGFTHDQEGNRHAHVRL